ncbi:hypothetical protein A8H39_05345 [Paraburkholderia fungorum]|jgi:hypothetical protein|uniref:hypothetical protein n=1 Tax=Paraburkholderia fungorum TaxID=134537 RepID=UPI00048290F9|nr:hypothetical protein [Paraburkholderia fungorum]MBB5542833.1 hypothetical protein [Paraburkholderia fungorum]PNE55326.1 hypothetical protein A8H39_05345 [Paraburkholderia fungorum]
MNWKFGFNIGSDMPRSADENTASSGKTQPNFGRHDEIDPAEFKISLDPADSKALPVVDLSRSAFGFKTVVAMYRDGMLGSTELPKKQFED